MAKKILDVYWVNVSLHKVHGFGVAEFVRCNIRWNLR